MMLTGSYPTTKIEIITPDIKHSATYSHYNYYMPMDGVNK